MAGSFFEGFSSGFDWADGSLTASGSGAGSVAGPSGGWAGVFSDAVGGYLEVYRMKEAADAQQRMIDAQLKQQVLLGSAPTLFNQGARLLSPTQYQQQMLGGSGGGGGLPVGGVASGLGGLPLWLVLAVAGAGVYLVLR